MLTGNLHMPRAKTVSAAVFPADHRPGPSGGSCGPVRVYPFSALVGQADLRLALVLAAINPAVGGVLIRGEKGTAKSTAVRGLAAVLPEIRVVDGCVYGCDPDAPREWCPRCGRRCEPGAAPVVRRPVQVVTLPLNATEDRVAGGIDFEAALQSGRRRVQPGLLAAAHRGILYVDEVNLLDDHIVDVILDAAAAGRHRIEREGVSLCHPARFVLVGTMNPEEGSLRPQLLDRFGLCVDTGAEREPARRVRLMRRREAFDADPAAFCQRYRRADAAVAARIVAARRRLEKVVMPGRMRALVCQICTGANAAGHRAELVMECAARALAALEGATEVTAGHVRRVSPLVLSHRRREPAPPPPPPAENHHQDPPPDRKPPAPPEDGAQPQDTPPEGRDHGPDAPQPSEDDPASPEAGEGDGADRVFAVGETFRVRRIETVRDRQLRRGSGRRSRTRTAGRQGRYVMSTARRRCNDIALDATLRAAAPFQGQRPQPAGGPCVCIRSGDIREKIRERRTGNFMLFVVDASGSMGARGRMAASKGAILSLLLDAYQKRDRVAMVAFRRTGAQVVLPPTASVETAGKLLSEMAVGGRTPLSAGLFKAEEMLRAQHRRDPAARPILLVITDGRANLAQTEAKPLDEALAAAARLAALPAASRIVVDTEPKGLVAFGLARRLAVAMEARYFKIEDLRADHLTAIVQRTRA